MPRHTLSHADSLYYGNSQNAARFDSQRGIPFHPVTFVDLGAPVTLDADGLIVAATGTELPNAETVTYIFPHASASPQDGANLTGIMDVPRNITGVVTHSTTTVLMTVLVTGTDVDGHAMSELLTFAATATTIAAAGKKAFKTVTSIAITSASDAEANTLNMGWGDVLGLPFALAQKNNVLLVMDGALIAATVVAAVTTDPATTTTGDVRGTLVPGTATNGTRRYGAWMLGIPVAERSGAGSAYGVQNA